MNMDHEAFEKLRQEKRQLREEKRRLKQQQNPASTSTPSLPSAFRRTWKSTLCRQLIRRQPISIMTYNILAQNLCQRAMHPSAGDMLKWKTRRRMVLEEISYYKPDLMCLQEVDNYDEFYKESLAKLGYTTLFHRHETKRHGCLIGYQSNGWDQLDYRTIDYDNDQSCQPTQPTGNIGQLVALTRKEGEGDQKNTPSGVILGNTHLYWRCPSTYERCRQGLIYMHHLWNLQKEFTKSNPDCHWSPLMLGDFNTQPSDPFYSIVTNKPLTDNHSIILEATRRSFGDDDNDFEPELDENAALAPTENTNGHLMDIGGLINLIGPKDDERMQSVYSHHKRLWDQQQQQHDHDVATPKKEHDFYNVGEPDYTNYAHVFKGTLDYLFIPQDADILDILMLPPKEVLNPAIPNQHFGSDHLCLLAKIVLP